MKKIIIITLLTLLTGCGVGNMQSKTSFNINEEATIDNFKITCTDFQELDSYKGEEPENGIFLKVNYKLINIADKNIPINNIKYFKILINNKEISPIELNNNYILEGKNDSASSEIVFDIPEQDSYQIIFYSNVVTNNISFIINK